MMVFFLNGTSLLRSISGPGSWGKIMTVKFSLPNAPRSIYFFFFNFSLTKRPVSRHFSASNRNRRENGPYLTGGAWKSSQPDTRAVVFGRLVAPARDEVTSLAWRDLRPGKRRVFYCLFVFFSWRSRKRTDLFVECFFFAFHIRIAVVSGHWKTRRIRGFPTVPVGRAGRAGPAVWRSVRAIRRRSVLERCRAIEPYLLPNWRRKIENDEIPGHLSLSLSFSYWLSHFAVRHRTIKTRSVHDKVCTFNGTGAFVPRGVPVEKSQ